MIIAMARYQNIDEQMANLNVDDEENEGLIFVRDVEVEINKYDLCLVGKYLTKKYIKYKSH